MFGLKGKITVMLLGVTALAACGGGGSGFGGGGGSGPGGIRDQQISQESRQRLIESGALPDPNRDTIFDLFDNNDDPNVTVEVNRYIWNATLEILDFMPIEAADPFSGVIVYGYGTPPGGGRAYRATVYVPDPALDARSLRVALQGRGGGAVISHIHANCKLRAHGPNPVDRKGAEAHLITQESAPGNGTCQFPSLNARALSDQMVPFGRIVL